MADLLETNLPVASLILSLLFGYLLGSTPFGLVLTRLAGRGDVRAIGSGNIGATNVLRTGSKGLAAATLLGDALKGTVAVLVAGAVWPDPAAIAAAIGAFLGHLFPLWLKFRGGKGVATYIGILIGLAWPLALAFCGIWIFVALLSRYSSLAALVASLATPALFLVTGNSLLAATFAVLTLILWIRHRDNIGRLLRGAESRIGESRTGEGK